MSEERKVPLAGYEGVYVVSSEGYVEGLSRTAVDGRPVNGRRMKPYLHPTTRRLTLSLRRGGRPRHPYLHILVAKAFVPNPDGHSSVKFKDGDVTNCRADNLVWCAHGKKPSDFKPSAKINLIAARQIREERAAGKSAAELAKQHNISLAAVSRVLSNETWKEPTTT